MTPEDLESARAELREIASGLRALLEWHGAAGSEHLPAYVAPSHEGGASTVGREEAMLEASAPDASPRAATPRPTQMAMTPPPVAAAAPALSIEERVRRLGVLKERVAGCTACVLHEKRTQTVFARGNPAAELCFVGEGPGEDEDASGLPFVGRAGQLLDKMIAGMGLTSDEVYICNVVKCRPPNNRNPLPPEMSACAPYVIEQLELASPKVIVTLGNIPLKGLCGVEGITKLRGTWRLYRGSIPVMPTYHPSYVLRNPSPQVKREVWSDLREVLKQLGREPPARRAD